MGALLCIDFAHGLAVGFPVVCVGFLDVFFQIGNGAAVGTQEVWPGRAVEDGADAFVVPDM